MESKCLEYVKNQIAKLKDDLQHYTMVEKDSALASQIRYDLEQFETIENKLKALEIIKENKIEGLTLEWDGTWWTICVPNYSFPIAYGRKKEEYDLLKEV